VSRFPMIRLTMEGMRHEIVHAVTLYHDDLERILEAEAKRQIEAFDVGALVEAEVAEAIRAEVKSFFGWGEGRKMIREAFLKAIVDEAAPKEGR